MSAMAIRFTNFIGVEPIFLSVLDEPFYDYAKIIVVIYVLRNFGLSISFHYPFDIGLII